MGLGLFKNHTASSLSGLQKEADTGYQSRRINPKWQPSNPNPKNFEVENVELVNGYTILVVKYPDCTNMEGRKILVLKGEMSPVTLANMKTLDPHFCEHNPDLIARFRPGHLMDAIRFCETIMNGDGK